MSIESLDLPNYILIGRRDRAKGPNRGGVISFVRHDVANVVHHSESPNAERMWHLIQRDTGSVALCNWYFLPTADLSEISSLGEEIDQMLQLTDFY